MVARTGSLPIPCSPINTVQPPTTSQQEVVRITGTGRTGGAFPCANAQWSAVTPTPGSPRMISLRRCSVMEEVVVGECGGCVAGDRGAGRLREVEPRRGSCFLRRPRRRLVIPVTDPRGCCPISDFLGPTCGTSSLSEIHWHPCESGRSASLSAAVTAGVDFTGRGSLPFQGVEFSAVAEERAVIFCYRTIRRLAKWIRRFVLRHLQLASPDSESSPFPRSTQRPRSFCPSVLPQKVENMDYVHPGIHVDSSPSRTRGLTRELPSCRQPPLPAR